MRPYMNFATSCLLQLQLIKCKLVSGLYKADCTTWLHRLHMTTTSKTGSSNKCKYSN